MQGLGFGAQDKGFGAPVDERNRVRGREGGRGKGMAGLGEGTRTSIWAVSLLSSLGTCISICVVLRVICEKQSAVI